MGGAVNMQTEPQVVLPETLKAGAPRGIDEKTWALAEREEEQRRLANGVQNCTRGPGTQCQPAPCIWGDGFVCFSQQCGNNGIEPAGRTVQKHFPGGTPQLLEPESQAGVSGMCLLTDPQVGFTSWISLWNQTWVLILPPGMRTALEDVPRLNNVPVRAGCGWGLVCPQRCRDRTNTRHAESMLLRSQASTSPAVR